MHIQFILYTQLSCRYYKLINLVCVVHAPSLTSHTRGKAELHSHIYYTQYSYRCTQWRCTQYRCTVHVSYICNIKSTISHRQLLFLAYWVSANSRATMYAEITVNSSHNFFPSSSSFFYSLLFSSRASFAFFSPKSKF